MTGWTVVTRPTGRGQFQPTGFAGTWHEARDHAQALPGAGTDEVYIVGAEDKHVLTDKGRKVGIALAPEARAAARAEAKRIEEAATRLLDSADRSVWPQDAAILVRAAIRFQLLPIERMDSIRSRATQVEAARALAKAGDSWSTICNAYS